MKKRLLVTSDNAVVGIVVTVLILGLIVSVLALVQTQYIPKWMEEKESEHMEEVVDQFTRLKFAMDTQIATNQVGIPIATTITLGSKELPFLLSQRAFGYLQILSHSISGCVFEITTDNDTTPADPTYIVPIGTIMYSSANAYYLNQEFIYEAGAIITNQSDGYDMTIKPSFSFTDISPKTLKINLVNLSIVGGKSNGGGYGSTAILTELTKISPDNTNSFKLENVTQIKIKSNFAVKWFEYMNRTLNSTSYNIDITPEPSHITDEITIKFITSDKIKLELKVYKINAQVGPGWIE